MSSGFRVLADVQVSIDKVVYVPTLEAPADRPFPFVYFITIQSKRQSAAKVNVACWSVWVMKVEEYQQGIWRAMLERADPRCTQKCVRLFDTDVDEVGISGL